MLCSIVLCVYLFIYLFACKGVCIVFSVYLISAVMRFPKPCCAVSCAFFLAYLCLFSILLLWLSLSWVNLGWFEMNLCCTASGRGEVGFIPSSTLYPTPTPIHPKTWAWNGCHPPNHPNDLHSLFCSLQDCMVHNLQDLDINIIAFSVSGPGVNQEQDWKHWKWNW